jgi:NDP-sugar pyrophosphorylase family protein
MEVILTCFESSESFGPLTRLQPVGLLPALNVPLLQHQIEMCVSNGLKDIHIAVVDHPVPVRSFVGDGSRWGASIKVWTLKHSCSASETIAWLANKLVGPVLVLPVEHFVDIPLADLIAFHDSHAKKVSTLFCEKELIATSKFNDDTNPLDLASLVEPVNSGVMIADSPADADSADQRMTFSGNWIRINTPASLWTANMACLDGHFPLLTDKLHVRRDNSLWLGHHTSIDPSADINGPILIGDLVTVGTEAKIGPYAIIGNSSIVARNALIRATLIFDHVYVGDKTNMEYSMAAGNLVMNMKIGTWVAVTDPFLVSCVREKILIPWTARFVSKSLAILMFFLTAPIWVIKGIARVLRQKPFFDRIAVLEWDFTVGAAGLAKGSTVENLVFEDSGNFVSRLPGLIDVIRGRLSMVGVRPLKEANGIICMEDWAIQRFNAPAGLFTPVDAEGMNDSSEEEQIVAESLYAVKRSFREDFSVLVRAIRNLVFGRA